MARLGSGHILSPRLRTHRWRSLLRVQHRFSGPFHRLADGGVGADLLLVVARAPADLRMIESIGHVRRRFRAIAGFVVDSYFIDGFEPSVRRYDHIFSTTDEGANFVRKRFGVSSSVLRQGFDCLNWATTNSERFIDVIGFGRQPPSFHNEFQKQFHTSRSNFLYLHSPLGSLNGRAVWDERPMILKLMQRSKLSLAFHLLIEPQGSRPRAASFVTSRWFESLGTGCVVVGKRPPGQMATELFPWTDALIELPDLPSHATDMIKNLATDMSFLNKTRIRNVLEMCSRHDWRYRIREIYQFFGFKMPQLLVDELTELELLVRRIRQVAHTGS